jgi:hypothetical protein
MKFQENMSLIALARPKKKQNFTQIDLQRDSQMSFWGILLKKTFFYCNQQ